MLLEGTEQGHVVGRWTGQVVVVVVVVVVEAETRLGRWRPVRVVDGWGGRWRRLHDRKLVHITVRGFVDVVEAGRGSLVQI